MSLIKMSFEDVRQKASEYSTASSEIEALLARLEGYQSELSAVWEGSSFQQFDSRFEELKPQIRNFENLLMNISEFLNSAAGTLEEADAAIANATKY
ncbi:MAG: WXG100 family type VII secretion target [Erysipelothrix sp.]